MSYNNLDDSIERISQPKNITIPLMEHQKTAVFAMSKLESDGKLYAENIKQYGDNLNFNIETTLGILADKVGSGKSLMMISLINNLKVPVKRETYWEGSKFIAIKSSTMTESLSCNLLIVPHKLLPQWVEFFKLAPNLKIDSYKNIDDENRFTNVEDFKDLDVICLACTKSTQFFNEFQDVKWARVIIDEADSIKLSASVNLNASFVWLVTATPKSLRVSNKAYLTRVFKNMAPWVFNYLIVKNNLEFIEKSIILPVPKRITIRCLTPRELEVIGSFIPKNILSMINAGNTDEAIRSLNCNVNTNDNIMKVVTNNLSEAINNKQLELECESKKIYHNINAKLEQETKIKKINKCIERLQTRYDAIKEKIYGLNDQYCPICMDEFTNPVLLNCCQNVYCFECITLASSINGLCPCCRKKVFKENLHVIATDENNRPKKQIKEVKEKLDILIELLESSPDGKFLVFANFPQTFDKIKTELKKKSITYKILKGTTCLVQKTIDEFKEGKIRVIMLNAKFFGAGMNLQMATHVVLYHRFESDLEEQVIGRAQRLGRTTSLNVIYLIHDNENSAFDPKDKFDEMNYETWLENEDDSIIPNNVIQNNIVNIVNTVAEAIALSNIIEEKEIPIIEKIIDDRDDDSISEDDIIVVKPVIKSKKNIRRSSARLAY